MKKSYRAGVAGLMASVAAIIAAHPAASQSALPAGDLKFLDISSTCDTNGHRVARFERNGVSFPMPAEELAQRMLNLKPRTPQYNSDYIALTGALRVWDRMPLCPGR